MTDTPRPENPENIAETETATAAPETACPDPLAEAQTEIASLKDKLLRTLAEMENLRRRTEREVADARAYGVSSFARDILGVADNMRRALDAINEEQKANGDPALKMLIEGVELTERELEKLLEKNGVRKIEPQGEKFDPNLHQAMFEVPDASVPAGSVVQVVQPGYLISDRILRPALVGVSKGGPKTAPQAKGKGDAGGNGKADAAQEKGKA